MGRPKIQRKINCRPAYSCFKPNSIPMTELTSIVLADDELEALRLVDMNGMQQLAAAHELGVSRQTLGSIVSRARQKVAQALVTGQALDLQSTHLPHTQRQAKKVLSSSITQPKNVAIVETETEEH
jgi:uncharacterized protein